MVITQHNGTLVVDSRLIAQELGIEHKHLLETIRTYQGEISDLGVLPFQTAKPLEGSQGGRPQTFIYLNELQAAFVATLSRNTPKVVQFKLWLVKAFAEAKQQLEAVDHQALSARLATLEHTIARLKPHHQKKGQKTLKTRQPDPAPTVCDLILQEIAAHPESSSHQIAERVDMSESYIRRTLAFMKVKGMISRDRDGTRFVYRLPPSKERPALPPNLVVQLAANHPQLGSMLQQCQTTLNSSAMIVEFPSQALWEAFVTDGLLQQLILAAHELGIQHIFLNACRELQLQCEVAGMARFVKAESDRLN